MHTTLSAPANPHDTIAARQWLTQLTEHLPQAFIAGRLAVLLDLWKDGATPHLAAVYCRAFLHAPREL